MPQNAETSGRQVVEISRTDEALREAPVIYIDGAQAFIASDQFVKFNLIQDLLVGGTGPTPATPLERVVCARLVMSPMVFRQLATWVADLANKLPQEVATTENKA
jgi:hypothetical protein